MKKKFTVLQKQIEDQKEDIKARRALQFHSSEIIFK